MPKPTHTVLAFDFGLSQIGVAVGNSLLQTTEPLPVLRANNGKPDWAALETLINEWCPDLLVVGDPINMDDSVGELAIRSRKFARRLEGRFGKPIAMTDERLTSFEAKLSQRERGHKGNYKKNPVDSIAAELILQTWIRQQS
ncbi:MAG: Holliday junction resolvase RuvX [Halieaceae bacterium]|nr:Holliday junction resolvase RuvX [Halieaceae bacterium]